MKKFIIVAAFMMATIGAFAQHEVGSLTVQPRIGFSAADFNNTDDTKARVGMIAGAEFEYTLANKFSLGMGLNYSQQGAELDKTDVKYKIDYLTVPIVANFYLFKGFALKAGIQPGINLSSKIDGGKMSVDMDEAVNTFDFAIPVGLSYEFYNFVIDARYTFGVTKVFDQDVIDLNSKNLTFQLSLGYKFSLF